MKLTSKTYDDDLEIITITVDAALTITVEIFNVPAGYKSFARNSYLHHDDILGSGFHQDKKESMELAIKDLQKLMDNFDISNL